MKSVSPTHKRFPPHLLKHIYLPVCSWFVTLVMCACIVHIRVCLYGSSHCSYSFLMFGYYFFPTIQLISFWDYIEFLQYVCILKTPFLQLDSQKQDCNCFFVAHSCPTLGIIHYSPGGKGFSEDLLIGCNLLLKLERRQASSLAVYKQLMQGTAILLVTTGVYLFPLPAVPSCLICTSQRQTDSSCISGPAVNIYSVEGLLGKRHGRGIWSESWSVRGDDGRIWGSEGFPS